jgi:hypothetical protein
LGPVWVATNVGVKTTGLSGKEIPGRKVTTWPALKAGGSKSMTVVVSAAAGRGAKARRANQGNPEILPLLRTDPRWRSQAVRWRQGPFSRFMTLLRVYAKRRKSSADRVD